MCQRDGEYDKPNERDFLKNVFIIPVQTLLKIRRENEGNINHYATKKKIVQYRTILDKPGFEVIPPVNAMDLNSSH